MTLELWTVCGAIVLGLVHVGAQSFALKAQAGNAYTMGPRDEVVRQKLVAGRLDRALRNFIETFPLFAAAVLLVHISGRSGGLSAAGASMYLAARALYLPAYALAVPYARTIFWQIASIGIVLVLAQLFFTN